MVVVVGVVVGYCWWRSCGGSAGDGLFNGGSCNICRSPSIVVVVVLVVVLVGMVVVAVVVVVFLVVWWWW